MDRVHLVKETTLTVSQGGGGVIAERVIAKIFDSIFFPVKILYGRLEVNELGIVVIFYFKDLSEFK